MANDCYNWLEIISSDKKVIEKIHNALKTIGYNGSYGYRDLELYDNKLIAYSTTKWTPPIEQYQEWVNENPGLQIRSFFKDEFLDFAGTWTNTTYNHIELESISSNEIRNATEGLLYDLNNHLYLADHMDDLEELQNPTNI